MNKAEQDKNAALKLYRNALEDRLLMLSIKEKALVWIFKFSILICSWHFMKCSNLTESSNSFSPCFNFPTSGFVADLNSTFTDNQSNMILKITKSIVFCTVPFSFQARRENVSLLHTALLEKADVKLTNQIADPLNRKKVQQVGSHTYVMNESVTEKTQ